MLPIASVRSQTGTLRHEPTLQKEIADAPGALYALAIIVSRLVLMSSRLFSGNSL